MEKKRGKTSRSIFRLMLALVMIAMLGATAVQADTGGNPDLLQPGISPQQSLTKQLFTSGLEPLEAAPRSSQTIALAPTNDDMVDALIVGALPYTDSVDTTGATVEGSEPSYVCGSGVGATVWYRYTPASDGEFVVDTIGSDFNTVLHVFLDDGTPTFVDCDDNGAPGTRSLRSISGLTGTTYLIGVGGYAGATGNLVVNIHQPGPFSSCAAVDVSEAECDALVALYTDTAGASWYSSAGWLQSDEVCTWQGIECFAGFVDRIEIPDNNLTGVWTTDLTGMPNLRYLFLQENNLSGEISLLISSLPSSIESITLYSNSFTGNFPASLASLTNLWKIVLFSNNLSGNFGTAVGNLPTGIEYLDLSNNAFTGAIPIWLSGFSSLSNLMVEGNQLSGDLGVMMDYIPTSILVLNLRDNSFTGTLPASTLNLTSMWSLDVGSNMLAGDLADVLGNLPLSIANLHLNDNLFTGSVPSSISGLTNLNNLRLSYNQGLVGEIPLDITGLTLNTFRFDNTYLCEPADASYTTWKGTISNYAHGICGYAPEDLTILGISTSPAVPTPGDPFTVTVQVMNEGGASSTSSAVDLYSNRVPTGCGDPGDYTEAFGSIEPGYVVDVPFAIPGQPAGVYDLYAYVDNACVVPEGDENNNQSGPESFSIFAYLFEDDFETGDFSLWSRYNDGGGWLYACESGAVNGTYGACVERGTNDRRKQLIDETPVDQTTFHVRFNFDPNGISMLEGERFRFMQTKLLTDRPFFMVMRYAGGEYLIQLKVRQDDGVFLRTSWFPITDAPHTIEINWMAATAPGANDGYGELWIDDVQMEMVGNLDNDTIYVDTLKIGFTSRLEGKSISGIFFLDDIATSNGGHIGLP